MIHERNEALRRSAVAWAIALTRDTALAPDQFEQELLNEYTQGHLSLEEVLDRLDKRVQHVLYRSQARHPLTHSQLTDLQEQSQAWNGTHQITGLLCYTDDGHFVQVLEGTAQEVHKLFTKIRQDQRHHHVTLLSDKTSDVRWFADWQMAFVHTPTNDFYWLLGYLEAKGHNLVCPQIPITDPRLLTLLQQFSKT